MADKDTRVRITVNLREEDWSALHRAAIHENRSLPNMAESLLLRQLHKRGYTERTVMCQGPDHLFRFLKHDEKRNLIDPEKLGDPLWICVNCGSIVKST